MVLTRQQIKALEEGQIDDQLGNGSFHQQRSEYATFKALNNPLLLDMIVKHSAYISNGRDLDEKLVFSLRLVSRIWHQSVSRVLKNSNVTLKKLSSVTDTCFSGARYLNTKVLGDFVSVFSKANRMDGSFLPCWLQLEPHHFIKENYHALRNLLENCGDMVTFFSVNVPPNGGSMPVGLGQMYLPNLQSLVFVFCSANAPEQRIQTNGRVLGKNLNGWKILREILEHTQKLKHFTLIQRGDIKHGINAGSLRLPASITSVELNGKLTDKELKLLTTNKLPNFESLTLRLHESPQNERMVYKVLDNLRTQLRTFCLKVNRISFTDGHPIYVQFPQMKNLKSLTLFAKEGQLLPEMEKDWPTLIPNLTRLAILGFTEPLILQWIQGSRFESVKKLEILPRKDRSSIRNLPNEQIMTQIQASFPNLQKLTLHFSFSKLAGLKYIFQNFAHLKKLRLNCHGKSDNSTVYNLASTLFGIRLEDVKAIKDYPECDLEVGTDNTPSIINLTELNGLTLGTLKEPNLQLLMDLYGIISFNLFGLEKIKHLKKLKFLAGLKPNAFEEFYPFGKCTLKKIYGK